MTFSDVLRVDLGGARVAYRDTGSGEPLLLVHGYPFSSQTWRRVVPQLTASYRCIAVDLLGAGDTEVSRDADLSIAAQARMLGGLLDALRLSSVTLVAHDSGAVIARLFAASEPHRVHRLIMFDTEVPGRVVPAAAVMQRVFRLPGAFRLFELLLPSKRFQRSRLGLGNLFFDRSAVDFDEFVSVTVEPLARSRAQRFASFRFGIGYDLRFADHLPHGRLGMPKLVLWGDHDAPFPLAWGRELFALLPEPKRFVAITDSGNLPHEERPDEWASAVRSFLESTDPARSGRTGVPSRPA